MSHQHIRYCDDLGMHTFSRGYDTCLWQTPWCKRECYWRKYRRMGWSTDESDQADNSLWQNARPYEIAREIFDAAGHWVPETGERIAPRRFRFSMKGEIWTSQDDVVKVRAIATQLPTTGFWIPTRAWRDRDMRLAIKRWSTSNMRVLASIDPSVSESDIEMLRSEGWSLMYAGDNEDSNQMLLGEQGLEEKVTRGMHRCRKTWEHKLGHCAVCRDGCFSEGRVEVHLKKHR